VNAKHGFVQLEDDVPESVEEEEEGTEVPERKPIDKPQDKYERLDDTCVEVSEAKEGDTSDIE